MYNPSSLAQALETVPAAEQALLESLRGPDVAQRTHHITIIQVSTRKVSPRNRLRRRRREYTDLLLSI